MLCAIVPDVEAVLREDTEKRITQIVFLTEYYISLQFFLWWSPYSAYYTLTYGWMDNTTSCKV